MLSASSNKKEIQLKELEMQGFDGTRLGVQTDRILSVCIEIYSKFCGYGYLDIDNLSIRV